MANDQAMREAMRILREQSAAAAENARQARIAEEARLAQRRADEEAASAR